MYLHIRIITACQACMESRKRVSRRIFAHFLSQRGKTEEEKKKKGTKTRIPERARPLLHYHMIYACPSPPRPGVRTQRIRGFKSLELSRRLVPSTPSRPFMLVLSMPNEDEYACEGEMGERKREKENERQGGEESERQR